MKVLQVVPLIYDIPPERYGGVELVVANVIKGLKELGVEVSLLGTRTSKIDAEVIGVSEKLLGSTQRTIKKYEFIEAGELLKIQDRFDIIHIHYYPFSPQWFYSITLLDVPFVFTVHSVLNLPHLVKFYKRYLHLSKVPMVSISNDQRKPIEKEANFVATVYNGIDVDLYPFEENKEDFLVFIGRLGFEKGCAEAISVAKRLGKKLYILAKMEDPEEKAYYEKYVKPEIDGKNIVYVGEVGFEEKVEYLKRAQAFIFPMQWREPFGLVMVEAMACGTPVVVPDRGSASEVVVDGKTGALVKVRKVPRFMDNEMIEGMVRAFKRYVHKIDPKECRKHVEENFTYKKMALGYFEVYKKVMSMWDELKRYFDHIKVERAMFS